MATRRAFLLLSIAVVGLRARTASAQQTPPPLHWEIVVGGATYDVSSLDPPTLPAAPGRFSIRYEWREDDKIEQWWQQVIAGSDDSKSIILYVKRGNGKKAIISYALGGVRLTAFHGPSLSATGGYSGPSTAEFTFQSVRVLPH